MRQTIRQTAVNILVLGTRKNLRKLILATIGIFVFLLADLADAVTNYTDMWFSSSESGWGVNFIQDYNGPIFATFFVYAANGVPAWVIAVLTFDSVTGAYSGALLETAGGAALTNQAFNPAAVTSTEVGTVTFTPTDTANGTLAYTYRGSAVVLKRIAREPLYTATTVSNATFLTFTSYGTAYSAIFQSRNNGQCSSSYPAHQTIGGNWRIYPTAVSGSSISFNVGSCDTTISNACVVSAPFCTFTGVVTQTGRILSVPGTLNCTEGHGFFGGLTGTLAATFYEIEHTDAGVNGKLLVTNGTCTVQSTVFIQRNDWLNGQMP